jgi:hypothetical protein
MSQSDRVRFHALRGRELSGEALTESEATELAGFYAALDAEEEALIGPALARREAETEALAQVNATLRNLLEREEQFAQRLETMLAEVKREHLQLKAERERVVGSLGIAA